MTFERPDLLVLAPLAVLVLGLALVSQWRRGVRLVRAYGGPKAAARLTGRSLERFPALRATALVLGALSLVLAAAGPGREPVEELPPTPVDLVIAVDVSHSMTGGDVAPSRIDRAQALIEGIVEAGVADRVALSLFADWPYGLVPLTDDEKVISFFTPWVQPGVVTARDQGTSLASLVGHSVATWQERPMEGATPVVLVISDGEAHGTRGEVLEATTTAAAAGVRVWTAGMGSEEGALLFVSGSDAPLLDGSGAPVVARYDADLLREMAGVGGGSFHDVSDDGGVRALISGLRDVSGRTETVEVVSSDPTVWLILAGLLLLVLDALLDAGLLVTSRRRRAER